MTQLNPQNTAQKLIDIDAVDAKALLGVEESVPPFPAISPFASGC